MVEDLLIQLKASMREPWRLLKLRKEQKRQNNHVSHIKYPIYYS